MALFKKIFITTFVVSLGLFALQYKINVVDVPLWAEQAQVFEEHTTPFKTMDAYGHPGGPLLIGTIFIHKILPSISYTDAITIFISITSAFIVAAICVLAFVLKRNYIWLFTLLFILSINRLYYSSTPPTTLSTLLSIFLCLLSLYIFERKEKVKNIGIVSWGIISGILIATRVDTGGYLTLMFGVLLLYSVGFKRTWLALISSIIAFCIFDPFMWFEPIQHVRYLVWYLFNHYRGDSLESIISFPVIFYDSFFAWLSIFSAGILVYFKHTSKKVLPIVFLILLVVMTIVLYCIVLTSHYQVMRYLYPIILIWETFLPLFMFSIVQVITERYAMIDTDRLRINTRIFWGIAAFLILVQLIQYVIVVT